MAGDPQPLGTLSNRQAVPAACLPRHVCGGLCPGWDCSGLPVTVTSQGVEGIWAKAGVTAEITTGIQELVCWAPCLCPGVRSSRADTRRGRSGFLFFRKAQPSEELWPGKAGAGEGPRQLCGSRVEGGHVLLRPKREREESNFLAHAQDTANWCKVVTSPWRGVSPFDSHLPLKTCRGVIG